jgi:hypothetical protein
LSEPVSVAGALPNGVHDCALASCTVKEAPATTTKKTAHTTRGRDCPNRCTPRKHFWKLKFMAFLPFPAGRFATGILQVV